jgi:glycerol uptake facilitator-like aquaporin
MTFLLWKEECKINHDIILYMKKYIAELFGTFVLTLAIGLSLSGNFPVSTPVVAGLVVMLFVYTIGHISGTHLNPAITIGAWSINKIKSKEALFYVISQFVGSALALIIITMTVGMPHLAFVSNFPTLVAEFLGTALFGFGVASIMYDRTPSDFSGVVAGGSLVLGIAVAALLGSYGVLNPAVAFGIDSLSLVYFFAPVVGSIVGMQMYKFISED